MAYLVKPPLPLTTPTPSGGLGQGVHPSVIDFLTDHGLESWAGHRYWMGFTPYPNYDDRYENPCLLVSADGQNWFAPAGITNPLTLGKTGYGPNGEPDTHDATGAFNADPCLVYQPELNQLWVFFASGKIGFAVFKISENLTVPEPVSVGHGNMSVSVLRDPNTGDLHYWDIYPGSPYPSTGWKFEIRYRKWLSATSAWASSAQFCGSPCEDYFDNWDGVATWHPWHIDTKYNAYNNTVEMLVTTSENTQSNGSRQALGLLVTTLTNPTVFTSPLTGFVIAKATGTGSLWDRSLIYKASQVIGASGLRRVWYSAAGGADGNDWHIGYTEGTILALSGVSHLEADVQGEVQEQGLGYADVQGEVQVPTIYGDVQGNVSSSTVEADLQGSVATSYIESNTLYCRGSDTLSDNQSADFSTSVQYETETTPSLYFVLDYYIVSDIGFMTIGTSSPVQTTEGSRNYTSPMSISSIKTDTNITRDSLRLRLYDQQVGIINTWYSPLLSVIGINSIQPGTINCHFYATHTSGPSSDTVSVLYGSPYTTRVADIVNDSTPSYTKSEISGDLQFSVRSVSHIDGDLLFGVYSPYISINGDLVITVLPVLTSATAYYDYSNLGMNLSWSSLVGAGNKFVIQRQLSGSNWQHLSSILDAYYIYDYTALENSTYTYRVAPYVGANPQAPTSIGSWVTTQPVTVIQADFYDVQGRVAYGGAINKRRALMTGDMYFGMNGGVT